MAGNHDDDDRASIASSSSTSSEADGRPHSPTSLFEDSLFSLFSHHQPAHGDPGDTCKYTHRNLPPRYTSSSRRPATLRYKIAENSGTNTKLFAHHQWDAGLYLADLIAEQSVDHDASDVVLGKRREKTFVDVRDKAVVELGAGTGLPGLVACVMGADRTVVTDYPDPHVIDNLERNLDLALLPRKSSKEKDPHRHYLEARKRVQVLGLGWGNADEEERVLTAASSSSNPDTKAGYDLVLAADVLWVSSAHPLLIHSIRKLLKRDRDARCVLIAGFHTGRPAVRRFFFQLAQPADQHDASLKEERKAGILPDWQETAFGGLWERNVEGVERAWAGASMPSKAVYDVNGAVKDADAGQEEEEMGDISGRGSWVVVASLRWADLD
ncbi:Nicotinamide N-methyltransferase-like protein [Kalmanozyma brasiliensis GHG001]|uniref:Nicotinamide N-methyltransferase-like protein n=1 Tax=Kalmanozyma brasiliensis (strain GHG001) TaxID=1365824 RepID=UPI002867BE72|nr:Nicotinamide N-methyltransferase-like protein [Kalmanozyma brasiliensis GHG001]KAF6767133.1 Nicotinamide N-methyltransferase-like protein [Kalmanozyma brasiliensis GHG001]